MLLERKYCERLVQSDEIVRRPTQNDINERKVRSQGDLRDLPQNDNDERKVRTNTDISVLPYGSSRHCRNRKPVTR